LDDDLNYEIERANQILHNRIVRMYRDKLCKGCARFDCLRTHFYTRHVHWTDEKVKWAGQKIHSEYRRDSSFDLLYRDLENVLDGVIWPHFEVVIGARREAKWLAKDSRLRWQLRKDQVHQCQLCNVLWDKAEVATLHDSSDPAFPDILLMGGPVFEDRGKHQCVVVSSW
jgi:hypothetical protein